MRKRIYIIMAILLVGFVCSLHAVINIPQEDKDKAKGIFEIRAYKNAPDPVTVTLYDALTNALTEIPSGSETDIYQYLGTFVTDNKSLTKKNAVFSYNISGSRTGSFTLEITPTAFSTTLKDGTEKRLETYFKLTDTKTQFSKTRTQNDITNHYTISSQISNASEIQPIVDPDSDPKKTDPDTGEISVDFANLPKFKIDWSVSPVGEKPQSDFWIVDGIINMGIKKNGTNGYSEAVAGRYTSKITVTLITI